MGEKSNKKAKENQLLQKLELIWNNLALRTRLVASMVVLLTTMMVGVLMILVGTGVFAVGSTQVKAYIDGELEQTAAQIAHDFGSLAVGGTQLSQTLSVRIDQSLSRHGLTVADLMKQPDAITEILRDCMDPVLNALNVNRASGAFFVLDATVNPTLPGAEQSKAGLFLRNAYPNAASQTDASISLLRGFPDFAHTRGIPMDPRWDLEFRVEPGGFFDRASSDAVPNTDISRQYWWNPKAKLADDSEESMLLTVPVFAADGTVIGVCGLEVSSMLFKLLYTPQLSPFPGTFTLLTPKIDNGFISQQDSLVAGRQDFNALELELQPELTNAGLQFWKGSSSFVGQATTVSMYPKDSVFAGVHWQVAVMLLADDVATFDFDQIRNALFLLAAITAVGLVLGVILIRRLLAPLNRALTEVQSGNPTPQTHIREIDDLFAFFAAQDVAQARQRAAGMPINLLSDDEFGRRLQSLTPAETAVFNLYVEGYDAKQVCEKLFLSSNTIKTHNRHIYRKLGVASRRELLAHLRSLQVEKAPLQ